MTADDGFYRVDELRERLSISTLVFHQFRPVGEHALRELERNGITRIELLDSPEQFDLTRSRSMNLIREVCQSCGIQIAAYHAHKTSFSDLDTEAKRTERVDVCRRQIDTMLEVGGTVWGAHGKEADRALITSYEELARHVEGTDATITVENFTGADTWVEDRIRFLNEIDHPQVGMILDIGHVRNLDGANPMCIPGGPTEIIGAIGSRLRHVHLHGFKDGVDHFPPFTEGDTIQWLELFRSLYAIEYSGEMNFEPSGEPHHLNAIEATGSAPERIVEMAGLAD